MARPELELNSVVFADSWADMQLIATGLDGAQSVGVLAYFIERMHRNDVQHNPDPNAAVYAMRAALRWALTDETVTGR